MRTLFLLSVLALAAQPAHAATDAYLVWATGKWGSTTVGNTSAKATTWGESADPDKDGLFNLLEYACDTDPTRHNPASDLYQFTVPPSGLPSSRYPQLFAWLRTDDPDLRITCQTSDNLVYWYPDAPVNFDQPPPANPHVWTQETGNLLRGLRQMHFIDVQSLAVHSAAFMRLSVSRRGSTVTSPGVDPFSFTSQPGLPTGSTARSSAILLGGFAGNVTLNIPAGVTLFVNGIAKTGSTATVKAGDTLWMQATTPGIAGVPRNYTLTIGGQSATWTFTTAAIAAVPDHSGTDSGYTPVETGVSDTGAAQISIPIVVSPGTAGMQPKLSINYSSQGGNGPLGVGFSLSGLSTISRVGRTVAQDGVKGGVNFDANDRFALDGQRLIAINGADGADGTEYRLEFDPTSRIRSYGIVVGIESGLTGPARWVVETKAGLSIELAAYTQARRFVGNINPVTGIGTGVTYVSGPLSWAITKITDSAGNSIEFTYDAVRTTHAEVLLTKIAYTRNTVAGLLPKQEVICEYEDRPDTRTSYINGYAVKMLKRCSAIESRATEGGLVKRVRRYTTAYIQDAINQESKLISIQETTTDGTALPSTVFEWPASSASNFLNTSMDAGFTIYDRVTPNFIGDFNGDGKTDYIQWHEPLRNNQYNLLLSTGTAFSAPIATGVDPDNAVPLIPADFDGDGKTDVMVYTASRSRFNLRLSNGSGFGAAIQTNVPNFDDAYRNVVAGDFSGDGRTDLLVWNPTRSKFDAYFSVGSNFSAPVATDVTVNGSASYPRDLMYVGEFNGDGKADLLVSNLSRGEYDLYYSTGSGFSTPVQTEIVNYGNAYGPGISGDFNGDGLTDFMGYDNFSTRGNYQLYLCDGAGFQTPTLTDVTGGQDALGVKYQQSVDFNGDGKMDMATWHTPLDNYRLNIWISNGTGFYPAVATSIERVVDVLNEVGDFNGDGKSDMLIYHSPISSRMNLFLNSGPSQPLIQKVTNGHGGYTTFAYKPLTDSSIYTKSSGTTYPCYELQASMYVVSSVTSRNGIDGDPYTKTPVPPNNTIGTNTVSYIYEGAWTCLDGRGFMGFREIRATDATAGIRTHTYFESSSPLLAGRIATSTQSLLTAPSGGSTLISRSDFIWNLTETTHATGRKTYFVSEGRSGQSSYEVNEPSATALIKSVSRRGPGPGGTMTYDSYGNLLESVVATTAAGETYKDTVSNTYSDTISSTKWHVGRLANSTVVKSGPNPLGGADIAITRSSSFAYHPTTGLLIQEVIEPSGGILRQQKDYTHDGFGNILTSTISTSGAASRTTTTTYTPDGRFVETTTNALNHTESKTYDPLLGNVLTQTGPNNLTTTWNYDAIGRPIQENRPDGTVTRSFYRRVTGGTSGSPPRAVHYVRVQSSGGAPKTVWYDLLDREIRTDATGFDGRTVFAHKVFNNKGEVTNASQPYLSGDAPLYSQMLYDAVGREYQQTDPGNRVSKTTYDGLTTTVERNYNPAALTDFQKAVTVVNAMGWTVQSSQYLGTAAKTITRKYDPYGNLRFVTDPANNTTELRYDVRGNKTYMSEPNSGTSTFTYNGFGELKTQTNAANQTVSLTYDKLGRVLTRTEPEGVTTFEYDSAAQGIGQLARESSGDFVRSYFYDYLSRPVSTVESHGFHSFAVSRSYDSYGRPDAMTYPTGLATRQVYTANSHLSEVQNAATTQLYWRALAVNARGQITQEVQGNGVVTDRAFDADSGLIDGITSTLGAAGDVQKAEFDFDLIGNLTARRDKRYSTPFSETFDYDTLNRLKTVTTTGAAAVTAAYNDLGNITSRTDVGSFSYGAASTGPHALTGVTGGAFNKSCGYDAKGNRTTDGATSLTYSSFNKPVRMVKGSDTLRFDYGPDRALYRQTTFLTQPGGATSQTVREYIGGLYERETTSEGLVRHIHYIAGGSGVAAILTDERSAASPPLRLRYIHKDHLGSVDVITDSAGAVVERQSYDAWGRRRTVAYNTGTSTWSVTYPATPSSAETHRGFTGHEMLDAVGLVHMGGRIYDPITARFLSPDPFVQSPDNLQNLNRYSYVLNNPLSFTDPSGFFFKSIAKLFQKIAKPLSFAVKALYFVPGMQGVAFALDVGLSFGSAFSGTLLAGGSVGDALRAGLKAGAVTYASASALSGMSQARGWSGGDFAGYSGKMFAQKLAEKTIAHGIVGGTAEVLNGGKFKHGFMSAAASAAASPLIYEGTHGLPLGDAIGTISAATVGGTVSVIGGGKFANGAMSGAMGYIHNTLDANRQEGAATKYQQELGRNIERCLSDAECVVGYSYEGSQGYGENTNKCSYWVHDMIAQSGGNAPMRDPMMPEWLGGTPGPASASQWHDTGFSIPGCTITTTPQNYDIYSDGTHMGIVYSKGGGRTVSASPYGVRSSGNRGSGTTYRRCNW